MPSLEKLKRARDLDRNAKILAHAMRYRITFPYAIAKLFFGPHLVSSVRAEAVARKVLDALVSAGELVKREGRSTIARQCYFPVDKTLKESNLGFDLATLWFSLFGKRRRHRVLHAQFAGSFVEPEKPPYHNNQFVIQDEVGGPVLLRVYHCQGDMSHVKAQIIKQIKDVKKKSRSWVEDGTLGIALLPATDAKRDALRKFLQAKPAKGGMKPIDQMRFAVETAPDENTFTKMLKELNNDYTTT